MVFVTGSHNANKSTNKGANKSVSKTAPKTTLKTKIKASLKISSAELACLGFILGALALWFALSSFANFVYPDLTIETMSAAKTYLSYAARNGFIFLMFASLLLICIHMRKSGSVPFTTYLQREFGHLPSHILPIIVKVALAITSFGVMILSYSAIKTRIPEMVPYSWDVAFMEWDRALFFGHDPWQLFSWIYDVPMIIRSMDFVYDAWASLMVGTWICCFLLTKYKAQIRYRFPIALILTWFIGGNLLAILLSSAGPCYFDLITAMASPYDAQMSALAALDNSSPLRAFSYQGILWDVYESPSVGFGGISAMPSMHCATSFLFVCLAWKHKVLRWAAIAFFLFIFIASFMLAWHYAVDGLIGAPIALGAWYASGKITRWLCARR